VALKYSTGGATEEAPAKSKNNLNQEKARRDMKNQNKGKSLKLRSSIQAGSRTRIRSWLAHGLKPAVIITAFLLAAASPVLAGNGNAGNPGILPPQSNPHGKTYGEWSAEWWKWVYTMPQSQHPFYDTADCTEGQSGSVWFLGGTFVSTSPETGVYVGTAIRDCTIPSGKALFFPILNAECSTVEGNGTTEADLRSCAVWLEDHITSMFCEIDGAPVKNLAQYRVQSPLFTFGPLPVDNILAYQRYDAPPGTTSPSVGDGVYLMLAPLSVGPHTIHFGGRVDIPEWGLFTFMLEVTYHLTVAPHQK